MPEGQGWGWSPGQLTRCLGLFQQHRSSNDGIRGWAWTHSQLLCYEQGWPLIYAWIHSFTSFYWVSICQVGEFALFLEYSLNYQGITPRQARGGIESWSIIRMCIRQGIERSGEGARLWGIDFYVALTLSQNRSPWIGKASEKVDQACCDRLQITR